MKKNLLVIVACALIALVVISCDDPKHEHSYSTEWKYNDTTHWHECSCGAKKDEAKHDLDAGKITKEATASEDGVKTYTCSVCDYTKTEAVPYSFDKTVNVASVDEFLTALNDLKKSTKIVLAAGTYDFQGKATTVSYGEQTGWMIPILVDNVKIVAAEGAEVKICSTDNIENGSWASQDLMLVVGKNFALEGISVGVRGSKNKSIEVLGENTVFKNCKFVDGACLYVAAEATLELVGKNTTVSNCVFEEGASISFTNGADTLKLYKSTFKNGSIVYLTGKRDSGWNPNTIKVSSIDFVENDFQTGSSMILKATAEDYKTCFADFDPVKLFGMTLKEHKDASQATYNAVVNTYVK